MTQRQVFSDEAILRSIRQAADACGEPLSHNRYDSVAREISGPSVTLVIQRFGGWRKACEAAGVVCAAPAREYVQRWNRDSVIAAVARYLAEPDSTGSFSGYVSWAQGDPERPSGATVRNILGGWSAAKRDALGN